MIETLASDIFLPIVFAGFECNIEVMEFKNVHFKQDRRTLLKQIVPKKL